MVGEDELVDEAMGCRTYFWKNLNSIVSAIENKINYNKNTRMYTHAKSGFLVVTGGVGLVLGVGVLLVVVCVSW